VLTILPIADLRAINEDVLPRPDGGMLLAYLHLHDVGWVLNDLTDSGLVIRSNLSQYTLSDEKEASR